ncbi:MAG: tRNA (adenosine(37)-N6)-threonylcarbamoyltransferase complex dimerization subunit type 1 TsaB [Eubacteriales bacterium]|jgi:tRNA threonylcarbamoyl adenosine modification protein YeaZ
MRLLAIDSSGLVASAAYMDDDSLLGEYTINFKKTHSQTLLPMIDELTKMLGIEPDSIDAVAVSKGPGSFTGLRIGSATAKGIGLALDRPIVEVPTVDALACNLYDTDGIIVPMMDARRSQVYTGIYHFRDHKLETLMEQTACSVEELAERINHMAAGAQTGPETADMGASSSETWAVRRVIFLGDGVPVYIDRMKELLEFEFSVAPAHLCRQRAGAVAWLGMQYLKAGKTVPSYAHHPEYLRKSQAEREKEASGVVIDRIEKDSDRLKPSDYGREDSYE